MGGYPRWGRAPLGSISAENMTDADVRIKGHESYGGSITINTKGYYGHEFGYVRHVTDLKSTNRATVGDVLQVTESKDRITVHEAYYNFLIYFMPNGERWRPFITGGAQAYDWRRPHIANWTTGYTRHYGANWGGGIKLVPVKHTLVRFDLRDLLGGKPYKLNFATASKSGGSIHLIEASAGVSITF